MSPSRAYIIASQWGSYMHAGDPGACFYGFRFNDGRPQSEAHRRACIAYAERCELIALSQGDKRDASELRRLRRFFETTELAT